MSEKRNKPGRGHSMDMVVLRNMVLDRLSGHAPAAIESKYGITHGVAARIGAKIDRMGLTKEQVQQMPPKELHELWYGHNSRGRVEGELKEYLKPDFCKLQEIFMASKKHGGSGTEIKCELTKIEVVEKVYLSDENKQLAKEKGLAMYQPKSVMRLWHKFTETKVLPPYQKTHEMGAEAQIDFTGVKVPYKSGNEVKMADILVMYLPASRYIVARAIPSQKTLDVIPAIVSCLQEFGGVPEALVVDNFKGAVVKASTYGGILNSTMLAMARTLGMELIACRPYHPTDKGGVEASVKLVTRSALSWMHYDIKHENKEYHSIKEINEVLQTHIARINAHKIRTLKISRNDLFAKEKEFLTVPKNWNYAEVTLQSQTVPTNCIFRFGQHEYAVPPKWKGNQIEIETTPRLIRFLTNGAVIVSYERKDEVPGLSTCELYTDERRLSFEYYKLEQKDFLLQWAHAIGPNVETWCQDALKRRKTRLDELTKQLVKVLSLCKGYCSLYSDLNQVVGNARAYLEYPFITQRIIDGFEKKELKFDGEQDQVYQPEKYKELCKEVLFGKKPALKWPVVSPTEHQSSELQGEFHLSTVVITNRYADVIKELKSSRNKGNSVAAVNNNANTTLEAC